jgi:hypothetical protein
MRHELKILPDFYERVISGEKTFEIRECRDRCFQVGDTVTLKEYGKAGWSFARYTGREVEKVITYVTNYQQKEWFVVFGIADLPAEGD